jgi:Domain of unknown function (DUF4136)
MRIGHFGARSLSLAAAAVFFCGLFLSGCDESITTFRDTTIPIPKHATWAWRPLPVEPVVPARADNRGDNRPVTSRDVITPQRTPTVARETDAATETERQQARTAIEQQLAKKGFTQASDPQAADFLVDYHLAVRKHNVTVARGYGGYPGLVCGPYGCWNSWGWGPPEIHYENIQFHEGQFVFDFVKRNTNQLAYRATGTEPARRRSFSQDDVSEMIHNLLKGLKGR